jgi:hypothetical protein
MSALFEKVKVRPMRDRTGINLASSALQKLCERHAYTKGDTGVAFAKKFLRVCDEVNSGIDVPRMFERDNHQQWPLTIAAIPRSLPYVLINEDPNQSCARIESRSIWLPAQGCYF